MSKQKEIREGLAKKLCYHDAPYYCWEDIPDIGDPSMKDRGYYRRWASSIFSYLDSQGVMIKARS